MLNKGLRHPRRITGEAEADMYFWLHSCRVTDATERLAVAFGVEITKLVPG
jgi:hypothetical protein